MSDERKEVDKLQILQEGYNSNRTVQMRNGSENELVKKGYNPSGITQARNRPLAPGNAPNEAGQDKPGVTDGSGDASSSDDR